MKKLSVLLAVALLIVACVSGPASAADAKYGFYNIGSASGITITANASSGSVSPQSEDVDGDKKADLLYNGSDKLSVTYDNATAGKYYMVWLVAGTTLPTSITEETVYYVNQATATGKSVSFDVFPKAIEKTMQMTLFITSNDGKAAVSVPVSYLSDAATGLIGDANGDGKVNAQDRVILSRYLAKWPGYDEQIVNMAAMDINKDTKVNAQDRVILSRYLAKWGGEYDEYFK